MTWHLRSRPGWPMLMWLAGFGIGLMPLPAVAQADPPPPQTAPAPRVIDPDTRPVPAEPDFRVVNLPTTLLLPVHRGNFTMTHRFAGNLREGSFADQLGDLFGMDRGANIGLEYRFGLARHVEAVVFRTNIDKTIQFSSKLDAVRQSASVPLSISGIVSIEGSNNFRVRRAPTLGAVISRLVADRVALYVTPLWAHDTAALVGGHRDTWMLGLAGRARIARSTFIVAEMTPRVAGYTIGDPEFGIGIEKRIGGHVFQLNVTNATSTTYGQLARGGFADTLFLGFNLSRKFF